MTHCNYDILAYLDCVSDLLEHEAVKSMENFTQHNGTDILEHSLYVSYLSFRVCRAVGLDARSAARGGLLHDFFLYQRHVDKPCRGWHTLLHPRIALSNAETLFSLNSIERDIIAKHMWPVVVGIPRFAESYIVSLVDKHCCFMESMKLIRNNKARLIKRQLT